MLCVLRDCHGEFFASLHLTAVSFVNPRLHAVQVSLLESRVEHGQKLKRTKLRDKLTFKHTLQCLRKQREIFVANLGVISDCVRTACLKIANKS